ncbi:MULTISPECIES: DUF2304 domain-containing protein [Actinokineospora]|uniref:DUF2304 domain-containing protein n=1 Tax=Actinokineospora fastidiosa TaxID=1816 RepID=A0A918L8B1_9PSEU|nr:MULTISPECIES: DUF2304 domain-containing protein [Actinokineospora]UVS76464.1 hypothetical protein Actkin_00151 [Actinokineospora sp. UTMC 2448]GGS17957.1 hypothetical protein GCM10010171_08090 [Actinokineospora fastidiosa]
MLIQILLILAVVGLLVSFLRHHGKSRTAAGVKIGFALFMVFGVIAVLVPSATSALAQLVGVGRGTDLLLYGTVVAFGFATINTYLRFKELEHRYAKLVRAMAIQGAEKPEDRATGS